jgi:MarC family membrane protein
MRLCMDSWMLQMLSMAFALFLLMDSIGNVPLFLAILKNTNTKRHTAIIIRELIIALVIILLFNFIGDSLLHFLNVKMPTILVSGGIILFLIAIKMIFPSKSDHQEEKSHNKEPLIVPLAIPLVAGPAVLAAVMLYSGQHEQDKMMTLTAIIVAWTASTLILLSSSLWKKLLGDRGLMACERLMGLILTLIAVQMFLEGAEMFMRNCR